MSSHRPNCAVTGPTRNFVRGLLVALACWLLHQPVHADVTVYQGVVPLHGATDADRNAAFGEALKAAAVRASGRRAAAEDTRIVSASADPSRYIQQYSTTADRLLKVGFDGRAMEQLLQQAGLPLWPAERPIVTIYLSGPAPQGLAAEKSTSERVMAEHAAQLRGVPLAWSAPAVTAPDATLLGGTRAVLVGVASGDGYDWTFTHAGQTARGHGSLADGIDLAADTLAQRYAPASTRGTNVVAVRVGNIDDVRDYAALTTYLQNLSLVRSLAADEFAGNQVLLRLSVRGDLELLRRIVALDAEHRLQAVAGMSNAAGADVTAGGAAEFLWRP
jgi:hypothetical protein